MPVLIRVVEEAPDRARIMAYHEAPDSLTDGQRAGGIIIDAIPAREQRTGQSAIMLYNPETGDVWTEYQDRPLTPEEAAVEEVRETMREEGREEIRQIVREADGKDTMSGQARQHLVDTGVLD